MKQWRALALAVLAVPAFVPVSDGQAAATVPVWWGDPREPNEGWHIRIPFSVTNNRTIDLVNATVGVDVDVRRALLDAGWTSGRTGSGRQLQAFELDERSVRVVEYRALGTGTAADGLLAAEPEVPSQAFLGFLRGASPFNNRTAPDLHVEWVLPGVTKAGATRYFYVYLDTKAHAAKPEAGYSEAQEAPLTSRYWISRGTTLYGRASVLWLTGLEDGTVATIEAYALGKPVPISLGTGTQLTNPLKIDKAQHVRITLNDEPLLVRIRSDKPIIASGGVVDAGSPNVRDFPAGPVPSSDGGLQGKTFYVNPQRAVALFRPESSSFVQAVRSDDEVFTYSLTPGTPIQSTDDLAGFAARLTGDQPFGVQLWHVPRGKFQFVSIHGAPVGSRLYGYPGAGENSLGISPATGQTTRNAAWVPPCTTSANGVRGGEAIVTAFDSAYVRGRDLLTREPRLPEPQNGRPPDASPAVSPFTPYTLGIDTQERLANCPYLIHGAPATGASFLDGEPLIAFGGHALDYTKQLRTPLGGIGGREFVSYWSLDAIAFDDATSVTVESADGRTTTFGLGKGDVRRIDASLKSPVVVRATKPLAMIPPYEGAFFAGVDESLQAVPAGPASYRGYLVSIEPAGDATEPLIGIAGPGVPAKYRLLVRNLGRDARGQGIPDTIRLETSALNPGWTANLSETRFRLEPGGSREVTLYVTPPPDAEDGLSLPVSVSAFSEGNPLVFDRIQSSTLVRPRYGVDLWFDREGGSSQKDVVLDPSAATEVKIVVKNLATVTDRILVSTTTLASEWGLSIKDSERAFVEMSLEPDEAREIILSVQAPALNASFDQAIIRAESVTGDSSAAREIYAELRVRSEARFDVEFDNGTIEAQPGGEARFRVTFRNRGSDLLGIRFNVTGALPDGWERAQSFYGEHHLDELEGLAPGSVTKVDLVQPVPANATRGARASLRFVVASLPQFAGDTVTEQSASLLVLVAARHDLQTVDKADLVTTDAGAARARLTLANEGNGDETLRVVPTRLPPGASTDAQPPARVPMGGQASVGMTVRVAPGTPAGVYPVEAAILSDDGWVTPWSFNVSVPESRAVALRPLGPTLSVAGLAQETRFEVANVGNVPLPMPPQLELPHGWDASWEESAGPLAPGGVRHLAATIRAPREASAQNATLAPRPAWASGEGVAWEVRTVRLGSTVAPTPTGATVTLRNEGTADATDVAVALVANGEEVDRVLLRRVAAGSSVVATLVGGKDAHGEAVVVVDAESRYSDAPARSAVRLEGGASAVPLPPLVALAAALAAAVVARRRR